MYRLHPCATVGNPLVSETDGVVFVFSLLLRFLFFVCLLVSWWFSSVAPPPKTGLPNPAQLPDDTSCVQAKRQGHLTARDGQGQLPHGNNKN